MKNNINIGDVLYQVVYNPKDIDECFIYAIEIYAVGKDFIIPYNYKFLKPLYQEIPLKRLGKDIFSTLQEAYNNLLSKFSECISLKQITPDTWGLVENNCTFCDFVYETENGITECAFNKRFDTPFSEDTERKLSHWIRLYNRGELNG